MRFLGLHPESIVARVRDSGSPARIPSLGASLLHGIIGFTLVSVAGFAPWALGGSWLHGAIGEAGLYAVCAVVFVALSGLLLHSLVIGPGSLWRFYVLFSVAFTIYSIAWIAAWMKIGGHVGGAIGLFIGTALMGALFCVAFKNLGALPKVIAALFVLNAIGYFGGGWVEAQIASMDVPSDKSTRMRIAMLSWGVCYGVGFGAGIGLAFYFCQSRVRELLKA